jgi:hypothetical protein
MSTTSLLVLWAFISLAAVVLFSFLLPYWLEKYLRRRYRRNRSQDDLGSVYIVDPRDISTTSDIEIRVPSIFGSWEESPQASDDIPLDDLTTSHITYPPQAHILPNDTEGHQIRRISLSHQTTSHRIR